MKRQDIATRLINLSHDISPDLKTGSLESQSIALILGSLGLALRNSKSKGFAKYLDSLSRAVLDETKKFRHSVSELSESNSDSN